MRRYKAGVFLALSFAISWAAAFVSYYLSQQHRDLAAQIAATFMIGGPGLAGIVCAVLFERGHRAAALGLRFKANWWWLLAYLTGILFSVIAPAAAVFVGKGAFTAPRSAPQFALAWLLINPAVQIVLATVTEELGWRGYLYGLWRPFGFWRYSLVTGLIWGVWHVPGIVLFKVNYPDHPWLGAAAFVPYCMLFAPVVTLMRDKGKSVITGGIVHGAANSTDLASGMVVKSPSDLWQGDTGLGGVVSLVASLVLVALVRRREPQSMETNDA